VGDGWIERYPIRLVIKSVSAHLPTLHQDVIAVFDINGSARVLVDRSGSIATNTRTIRVFALAVQRDIARVRDKNAHTSGLDGGLVARHGSQNTLNAAGIDVLKHDALRCAAVLSGGSEVCDHEGFRECRSIDKYRSVRCTGDRPRANDEGIGLGPITAGDTSAVAEIGIALNHDW